MRWYGGDGMSGISKGQAQLAKRRGRRTFRSTESMRGCRSQAVRGSFSTLTRTVCGEKSSGEVGGRREKTSERREDIYKERREREEEKRARSGKFW